jgi:hypothetical protein
MKKFYLVGLSFLLAYSSYSQCQFTIQAIQQSSCDTTCNSFLNISANGSNGPHYLFLDGSYHSMFTTFGNIGPLCPGTYDIFITDSIGCNFIDSVMITGTPGILVAGAVTDPSCSVCNDGSIIITVTGGTPTYNYIWSNSTITQNQSGLTPGTYCVTVADQTGCTVTNCFVVNQPNCSFVTQVFLQSGCDTTSCNSYLSVLSMGGVGPHYGFLNGVFHNVFTTAGTFGPLCPGYYDLMVTDSAGCVFVDSFFIFPPTPLTVALTGQDPSCPGCNDGFIVSSVTGGTPPYAYVWSNGSTISSIQGLPAGVYCVTVYDMMQCSQVECYVLGASSGFSLVGGIVYLDADTSGTKHPLEPGLANIQIEANPGGYSAWTSSSGHYYISVPNGSYTISAVVPAQWQQTSIPLNYNISVNDTFLFGNDFGLLPDTTYANASIYITAGMPRCNWQSYYHISYKNEGLMLAEGEIIFNMPAQVTFLSSNPVPTNVSGNVYTWTFNSLYPFQMSNISIQVQMPPNQGTVLNSSAIINLHDNLSNIIFTDTVYKTQTVTCAYDPNDKLALPEGIGSQNAVALNTSELDFTIRFQNTGTDTAFVVVLVDTLSSLLDLSTFEILAASHEMYAQMNPGGILTFTFDNILLPDSNVNEPGSHGFVRYRIQPIQPVTDPTVVTNTAHIIFDQNFAIVTNTTLTTFSDNLLSIAEIKGGGIVKAYPNPFSNEVLIQFEKNISAKAELYDYLGRVLENYAIFNTSSFVINRNDLKNGLYLLKITTEDSLSTLKLMIK